MKDRDAALVAEDFIFLEAPRWRDGKLWLSDVFDHKLFNLTPAGERVFVCEVPNRPSGQGFLPDGTHIVVSATDYKLLAVKDGTLSEYADLSGHAAGYLNDFAIDRHGRIYVGNFGYDYDAGEARKSTSLHRVDPDGSVHEVATGVNFPNGSVIIDGGRTLIVAETWDCVLAAYDLAEDGTLSNRRIFADLGDREPDGICADAKNAVWVACFNTGEVLRVLDGGEITDRIAFEGRAVSCILGGSDGRDLFCTIYAGSVEQLVQKKRLGAVYSTRVEIPALTCA
ncbi:SMP-30/gluconolactonase/LRE family protein [Ensifer sp. ENS07]|uniref:SMP-30/gluconolactonase/LRE family protein n=1 Tax=Ensifer sp. ENS07 TaxID=2769274 RepID=UPI001785A995|nr:SMP-30/gluconolactonase/LRE family protein [Ensifer sp. ENS07]MBD9638819.1 SMP-30/gluconolactonase/LRE family protein [Ensifer sp. ENS07]